MERPPPLASRKRSISFSSPSALASSSSTQATSTPAAPVDGISEKMSILALGAGQEVGRSCIVIQYRGCSVMLDCGLHTQRKGLDALPFFDMCALDQVDLLLVTHFHMDHIACLPYLTEHTNFAGRVFMTHPTKAVMRMLLQDYVRKHQDEVLYSEEDLNSCLSKCEVIDTHQTWEVNGISFKAYTAGHVLGACMYMVQIAGVNVLYTGDYSTEEDRHLMTAEVPSISPDVLIVESTFGIADHERREDREDKFTVAVEEVASKNKGCCLIPVFALGRAQELLLILDEYWQANHHLQDIPIYYANGMSSKAVRVYQTYINMMNDHIRSRQLDQPFSFKFIKPFPSSRQEVKGPCVVMATPGTLEGGLSGKLMAQWCSSERNGVILTGFLPEGTPAKELTRKGKEITFESDGVRRERNCSIHEMSFAAHVDFSHNYDFISKVRPANIVLVHGEKKTVEHLCRALVKKIKAWPEAERPSVHIATNVVEETNPVTRKQVLKGVISLKFQRPKRAKAVGKLAEDSLSKGVVNAVLVAKDFGLTLVSPEDLNAYAPLHLSGLAQRLHVPFSCRAVVLISVLQKLFVDVTVKERQDVKDKLPEYAIIVSSCVRALFDSAMLPGAVVLEWDATPASDMIADAVVAAAMHAQTSPQSLLSPPPLPRATHADSKSKSKKGAKKAQGEAEVSVDDALDASCALERELLLKLCDLLEMKFDMVRLVEVDEGDKVFDWHLVHREEERIPKRASADGSTTSEMRSKAWGLQVCEPVVRGSNERHAFSHASCLVRWVRGQGIVVESMPLPPGGIVEGAASDEQPPSLTPQCSAWTKKQLSLEKGIDSTLARAHVALGPMRANAVL